MPGRNVAKVSQVEFNAASVRHASCIYAATGEYAADIVPYVALTAEYPWEGECVVCPVTVSAATDSDRARPSARASLQRVLTAAGGIPGPSLTLALEARDAILLRSRGGADTLPDPPVRGPQAGKRSGAFGP